METSHFIRFPSEIRNKIWCIVLSTPNVLKSRSNRMEHSLTQTCRQIRCETLAMFYSLTRFDAHLIKGPNDTLLRWLRELRPENLLVIKEVNIWESCKLSATLYGSETVQAILRKGHEDTCKDYVLRPVSDWICARHGFPKVLKEIIFALHSIGLGLLRFCIVSRQYSEGTEPSESDEEEAEEAIVRPTSSFAVVRLDSRPVGHIFADPATNIDWLAQKCGLSERARAELIHGLADDQMEVKIIDGMKSIVFDFTSLELGGRIVDMKIIDEDIDTHPLAIA